MNEDDIDSRIDRVIEHKLGPAAEEMRRARESLERAADNARRVGPEIEPDTKAGRGVLYGVLIIIAVLIVIGIGAVVAAEPYSGERCRIVDADTGGDLTAQSKVMRCEETGQDGACILDCG